MFMLAFLQAVFTPEVGLALQSFVMDLLSIFITFALPYLVVLVINWLRQRGKQVRTALGEQNFYVLQSIIAVVVKAAEQSGLKQQILLTGAQKKAWAIDEAQRLLNERGLPGISISTISTLIEAALRDGIHQSDTAYPFTPLRPFQPSGGVHGYPDAELAATSAYGAVGFIPPIEADSDTDTQPLTAL